MYEKILLAYDGTLEGRAALREGAVLARKFDAETMLLAIVPRITSTDAMGGVILVNDDHQAILREGLERARSAGLRVAGQVVVGEPVESIAKWAEKFGADLVVVGHRRRTFLERWWSGPSHALLSDHLNCTLLISQNEVSDAAFSQMQAAR